MINSSGKCLLCSKIQSISFKEKINYCPDCDFAWVEESKENLKPAPEVESNENVWKHSKTKLFINGLNLLEKMLPLKGKLLDIGTGFGYFLDMARQRGWKVSGIEIEQKAFDFATNNYKLEIFNKPIPELNIPDNTYDAVTLWIVLEQLPDPKGEMRNIFRILKPGGVVYIRVYNFSFHRLLLNISRFLNIIFKMSPSVIHSYNFTSKSLRMIIKDTGFEDINITNSPASSGDSYSTGGIFGSGLVELAKRIIYITAQFIALITFNKLLLASTLIAIARKPGKQ